MNTKLTPRRAACTAFSAIIALEELLAGGRCFKITRSTDNALFVSVHSSGDPRALFKWRIPCRPLATDDAVADAVSELKTQLRTKNLLIHPIQ